MSAPHSQPVPRAVITCGPGVAQIDAVRRISNFSTGELGVRIAETLLEYGWEVSCYKGSAATYRDPAGERLRLKSFSSNQHLEEQLWQEPDRAGVHAVFQVAALCDYQVKAVLDASGSPLDAKKIHSRHSLLQVLLEPAPKVLPSLRQLFPNAKIAGWKFELEGDRASTLERGRLQLRENGTDLCVVNGAAFGEGFGVLDPQGGEQNIMTRNELCDHLAGWAARHFLGSAPETAS